MRPRPLRLRRRALPVAALLVFLLVLPALAAAANRPRLPERYPGRVKPTVLTGFQTPQEFFNGASGLAVDSRGNTYVSDYYHHTIDIFSPEGNYMTQITGVDPLDGPAGLAVDSAGRLYVNNYHRNVVRYIPSQYPLPSFGEPFTYGSPTVIDSGHSTGVAVDPATDDVYVNDRTYLTAYDPSGAQLQYEGAPLQIGLGDLGDSYGLAVSEFAATRGFIYAADYSDQTVKAYDPASDPFHPVREIDASQGPRGGFVSLFDSSLALDNSNGNLLVVDDTQPHYEHPAALVEEFSPGGSYRDQIHIALIHGEPSGIAIDESLISSNRGNLYITSGNGSEDVFVNKENPQESVIYAFGPAGAIEASGLAAPASFAASVVEPPPTLAPPLPAPPGRALGKHRTRRRPFHHHRARHARGRGGRQ